MNNAVDILLYRKTHARECSTFPYDLAAHPINPVDASVPGQQYMGCCRNLFLTPITPILGMQHLCCLCEIHMQQAQCCISEISAISVR